MYLVVFLSALVLAMMAGYLQPEGKCQLLTVTDAQDRLHSDIEIRSVERIPTAILGKNGGATVRVPFNTRLVLPTQQRRHNQPKPRLPAKAPLSAYDDGKEEREILEDHWDTKRLVSEFAWIGKVKLPPTNPWAGVLDWFLSKQVLIVGGRADVHSYCSSTAIACQKMDFKRWSATVVLPDYKSFEKQISITDIVPSWLEPKGEDTLLDKKRLYAAVAYHEYIHVKGVNEFESSRMHLQFLSDLKLCREPTWSEVFKYVLQRYSLSVYVASVLDVYRGSRYETVADLLPGGGAFNSLVDELTSSNQPIRENELVRAAAVAPKGRTAAVKKAIENGVKIYFRQYVEQHIRTMSYSTPGSTEEQMLRWLEVSGIRKRR